MKKLLAVVLSLLLALGAWTAFAEGDGSGTRVLVVYFSHAGENYNVGVIDEGNTAKMGRIIAEQTGADVFEIVPAVPYPESYEACLEAATEEQRAGARPEYVGEVENWAGYDTVFIGFPIWWGEIPNIVYTFMDRHDFTGKTVIPFNTHEGSGQARSQRDIEAYLPAAGAVLQGLAIRGGKAQNDAAGTAGDVSKWLEGLNLNN